MPDGCMVTNDNNKSCPCHAPRRNFHQNVCVGDSSLEDCSCPRCEDMSPRFRVMPKKDFQEAMTHECICCKPKAPPELQKVSCEIPDTDSDEDQLAVVREEVDCCCDEGMKLSLYIKGVMVLAAFMFLAFILYKLSQTYSKSHEILSVMLLLLFTLLVFEPEYFLPYIIINNIC